MNNSVTLTVTQETIILGNRIRLYGSIDNPLFLAKDVADWIDYSKNPNGSRQTSKMVKSVDDDEKLVVTILPPGSIQTRECVMITENGLYEVCMQSRKPIAKEMKKEIKKYLKSIRLTGAAIPEGNEQKMVSYYFSSLSKETQGLIVNELIEKNRELQQFYNDLMNTEGLLSMNTVSKELNGFGLKKLYSYLRYKGIMFKKDSINIPYQRFMNQGLFAVKETPCYDGKIRPTTYATHKGLDYIRKLLRKDGLLAEVA